MLTAMFDFIVIRIPELSGRGERDCDGRQDAETAGGARLRCYCRPSWVSFTAQWMLPLQVPTFTLGCRVLKYTLDA